MINIQIFTVAGFVYLLSALVYICCLFEPKNSMEKTAIALTAGGWGMQTMAYGVRWIETIRMGFDQTPLAFFTLYESLIFAAWTMALSYLIFAYKYRVSLVGAVIVPILSLLVLFASFSNKVNPAIQELPSVLRGNLFAPHAIASTAAFAAFIISFIVGFIIIIVEKEKKAAWLKKFCERLSGVQILDEMNYKAISVGFFLYTIGMATGAYRTRIIWGKYWSWDPAEVISLIMWLMYALVLHGRYQRWWGARATAMLSIFAFIVSVLCFLINASFLLISRHYPIV